MQLTRGRQTQILVLLLAFSVVVITVVLIWHKALGKSGSAFTSMRATYVEKSLGLRVSFPQSWIVLSASEAAMVTSHGQAALAESGHDPNEPKIGRPDGKNRLLTAMNPATGESFQILKQQSSVEESRPETAAYDLRSTLLRLLPMQALGPVELLDAEKPIAHFSGILTVEGSSIYQSIFIAVVKNTAITFVFSGPSDTVLAESKRSFPQWVSFESAAVR